MEPTLAIAFSCTQADYTRALRRHFSERLNPRLDLPVATIMMALGGYLWFAGESRSMAILCMVVGSLLGLMIVGAFTVLPHLYYRREPRLREPQELTFSPEGIHFRTSQIDSHLQWSLYQRAVVDEDTYLLYHSRNGFTLVPCRAFASEEDRRRFESLLERYVPTIQWRCRRDAPGLSSMER